MSAAASRAEVPNDLAAFWLPFTPNRAFKKRPRLISRAKDMHYYTPEGRPILDTAAALWCCNAGHNRDPIVARDPGAGGRARFRAELPVRPSARLSQLSCAHRSTRAGRSRPRVLRNSGSEAVDTALKIALAYHNVTREGLAPAPHRAGARLSRRRLRRHLRRRHGQQPQVLRLADRRRRSSALDLQRASIRPSPRASRNGARISPTSWSASSACTTPPPSPPSSSSRWRDRPACCRRRRAI